MIIILFFIDIDSPIFFPFSNSNFTFKTDFSFKILYPHILFIFIVGMDLSGAYTIPVSINK